MATLILWIKKKKTLSKKLGYTIWYFYLLDRDDE